MSETAKKEEKRVIVKCVDAYRDSERNRLVFPPMRLSVTKERATVLIDKKVCIEV